MLISVIFSETVEAILQEIELVKGKVDAVEIRLDFLEDAAWVKLEMLKERACLPLVFTFRKREDGGHREIGEKERLSLLEKALAFEPAFVDIEADADRGFVEKIAKRHPGVKLIGSHHDFEKTPEDLEGLLRRMHYPHFMIYKIAVQAKSTIDLMRLLVFAKEASKKTPLCCIAMGLLGRPSRALGPIVGNVLNYTSLHDSMSSLCQYSLDVLLKLYGFSRLTQDTKIYALLGDPVEESPGDVFHNEVFRKEGIHAIYVKLKLDKSELDPFFELARKLPFAGFSVTRPLKESVLPFVAPDVSASQIGAVNTIAIRGGEWVGTNTDAPGALEAIEEVEKVKGKKVAILGAGGSARAIAYEAILRGAQVMVFNRSSERGERLAKDFGCCSYALDALGSHPYDILVNTIPCNAAGELPILPGVLLPKSFVVDINHSSPLLEAARGRGCRVLSGRAMFENQARLQQAFWYS